MRHHFLPLSKKKKYPSYEHYAATGQQRHGFRLTAARRQEEVEMLCPHFFGSSHIRHLYMCSIRPNRQRTSRARCLSCSAQSLMTNEDAEASGGRARTRHVRQVVCLRWTELSVCVWCSLVLMEVIQRNLSTSRRNPRTHIDPRHRTPAQHIHCRSLLLFSSPFLFSLSSLSFCLCHCIM